MDLIELAERQYARIAPKPGAQWADVPMRKILVWLKDYVCPVVEEYVNDIRFRSHALWSLDVLARDTLSPVTRLVRDVDRSLVAAATALLTVAENKAIAKSIRSQNPPRKGVVKETVKITAEGMKQVEAVWAEVHDLPLKQSQVQRIAEHHYAGLVCRDDYFCPVGSLLPRKELADIRKQAKNSVTEGALVVSLTPELHLVGDFVTRSMFRRIEVWRSCLAAYRRIVYHAVEAACRSDESLLKDEHKAWTSLVAADAALRKACLTERAAQLREACIILTQTYATYHPNSSLAWLQLPQHVIAQGTSLFRYAVESGRSLEAADQIATALRALRDLQEPGKSSLENAIHTGGLVLVHKPPAVYWQKKEIDCSWDKNAKPFLLLWTAAEKARLHGGSVRDEDLWDGTGSKHRLAQLKLRLLGLLQKVSLSRNIVYVRKQGVQLKLDRQQIHLLETVKG